MPKNMASEGGGRQNNIGCKGGPPTKILSSFAVTAVSVIIESLSNEDGNGIENVTQKVNSRRFKLHRSYCNSFNSSNVGVFFQELNSIKNVSTFTKRKRNLSFFSFLVFFVLFVCLFFLEGGGHLNYLGKKGGHPKNFLMKRGGGHHILQELFFKSHQPPLPHKK